MSLAVGKQIKKFRQKRHLSQQDLADHLMISRQTISKWELGKSLPDLENVIRLAEYFDVSVDVLIGYKKSGFLTSLFQGRKGKELTKMAKDIEQNKTAFYSAYAKEIDSLFTEGKRVNTFLKLDEAMYPEVTFSRWMGNANCLCSVSKGEVTIDQIGRFKGLVNLPVEKRIAEFPITDIKEITIHFAKYYRHLGGDFMTLIDLVTEENVYFFWVNSLKAAHAIYHYPPFSSTKIQVMEDFEAALALADEQAAFEALREQEALIPLFYGQQQ
ncbi:MULTISPECIES: helix-turn-helix transcriptional regulator [unclassified Enterococcus]|uniref:helix-turn-helix transcriptional regulator n=1 Tax=unclassified Enterococcus TaxID=2608891 RepID=UPI001CE16AEB|nr:MULTISPECIES: helix-turn-helix transcriptional regulator [unclassified Enterococcus]MCA5012142.1 helix-turn-helix transcriptional regulator [Enterococcus sp. S23]MCA5015393.1 helix-turn-helix transcriptional regulator [Enterococcus sp. S22(2020)]